MENRFCDNESKYKFYTIGINYRKADARLRGLFSVSIPHQAEILAEARILELPGICVLSTCNRTELYGFAENPYQLIKLLCKYTEGQIDDFDKIGYVYIEQEAVNHLFKVATGLDSQILGDFEIISQLRESFRKSKEACMLNTYMERLANAVIQASKRVKNETELSTGSASVSFAAVRYIMDHVPEVSEKNILLFGIGKIGRNTVENLVKHTRNKGITLINRSREKAESLGGKFDLQVRDFTELQAEVQKADILIVATGAETPTITPETLKEIRKPLLILDLSVPQNVDERVDAIAGVERIHLDALSQITENTLNDRKKQIPLAEGIIEELRQEFLDWATARKFAPAIRALKEKFNGIKQSEIAYQKKKNQNYNVEQAEALADRIVERIVAHFANHLHSGNISVGDHLEMITQVFQLELKK